MNIPDKVRVGYLEYEVKLVEGPVELGNDLCYGIIEHKEGLITLDNRHTRNQVECSLCMP